MSAELIPDGGRSDAPVSLNDGNSIVGAGGDRIFYRRLGSSLSDEIENPRAIILFFHGIQSHCNTDGAETFAAEAAKNGMLCYGRDQRGHGYSEGTRMFMPSYQVEVDEADKFVQMITAKHPSAPFFLYGESWGGNLCLHLGLRLQQQKNPLFRGLLMIAPAVIADLPPAPVVFMLRYCCAPCCPRWTPFFMPNPVSPERIFREEADLNKMQSDPIYSGGKPFRLGTAVSLLQATIEVRSGVVPEMQFPFAVVHGTEDHAVLIEGTRYLDANTKTTSADKAILELEGAFHDVLHDPSILAGLSFLFKFADEQLKKAEA
jgi:alpha-beta hydrolase superfamily lysophospholipase